MRKWLFILCCFFSLGFGQTAQENSPPDSTSPEEVIFGLFIDNIYSIDWHENSIELSFFLWNIYTNPSADPSKTVAIENDREKNILLATTEMVDGKYWTNLKINAKIYEVLDVRSFPFIKQKLDLKFYNTEFPIGKLVYVLDQKNSGIDPELYVENWEVSDYSMKSKIETLPSTYGHPLFDNEKKHSVVTIHLDLNRIGWKWKLFIQILGITYLAYLVSLATFYTSTDDLQSKSAFTLGAIFGSVGNKLIIDEYLPWVDQVTLVDALQMLTFSYLLITLIVTLFTAALYQKRPTLAKRIDHVGGLVSLISFTFFNILIIKHFI